MACTNDYIEYLQEQVKDLKDFNFRKMFGEYALFYQDKMCALICDNTFYLKNTPNVSALVKEIILSPPYSGAKPHLVIEDLDDKAHLITLIKMAYEELPAPKPKKKKLN